MTQAPLTLTDENFHIHASKLYTPECHHLDEFFSDVARFDQIKLDLTRCIKTKENRSYRILINRIIVLFNDFTPRSVYLLFWKVRKREDHIIVLKTVLRNLGFFPQEIMAITPDLIINHKYTIDPNIEEIVKNVIDSRS